VVTGDIDSATAAYTGRHITSASRSGAADLTVDLTGVTHLGSAGVAVLADAIDRARRQNADFILISR